MDFEVVTIAVCGPCAEQCGRTRGYDSVNPDCDSPTRCACLCRQSNTGRR